MRFLKFIFLVLAICAISIALLEFSYRHYSTQADRVFKPYYAKANTVQTIYIGNSHIGVFNEIFPKEVKEVGIEWCIQQSLELKKAGVPCLHYYTMGNAAVTCKIAEKVF